MPDIAHPVPTLSVFFFSTADTGPARNRYEPVLNLASLADDLGYEAVWLPERHFHPFGGLYPNPAVTAAAIAMRTRSVAIRAGSVVLPLHHPARVAEEWAMVDAMSNGRAGLSLASGWNRTDFVLGRCEFEDRRAHTLEAVDILRALWRGDPVSFAHAPDGVRTHPVPMRGPLPLWLTATSGHAGFAAAGERGLRVLTAYLQQDRDTLADRIAHYRSAFTPFFPDDKPHVTLMVHACVADSREQALAIAREPLMAYQRVFLDLVDRGGAPTDEDALTDDEKATLARYAADKYATEQGLVGGPAEVADRLRDLADIGVDEVACLVDFGMPLDLMRSTLVRLAEAGAERIPAGPVP